MLKEQNLHAVHGESAVHVEALRRQRMQLDERQERLFDVLYVKAEQEKENRRQIAEFEELLAEELARRKAQQVRKEVVRQQVCNGSEELRALKEKLQAAQVNKVRARQLMEKQDRERSEQERQGAHDALVEASRLAADRLAMQEQQQKVLASQAMLKENQELLAQKELRQEAAQEFEKDKALVEDVVAKIMDEDLRDLAAREQKKKEANRILAEYHQALLDRRREDEKQQVEEDQRIEAYAREKRSREEQVAKEKRELEAERNRVLQELSSKQVRVNREAQEREKLREELWYEEREELERRKEWMKAQKRLEDQQEMLQAYQAHLERQERLRKEEAAKEQEARQALMEQFAEDERVDQMSAQRRRLKMQEYRREVDNQMEARKQQCEAERRKELEELARLRAVEAEHAQIVEEERRRLLKLHAGDARHFPKGALARESDLELVGLPRSAAPERPAVQRQRDNYLGLAPYPARSRAVSAGARAPPLADPEPEPEGPLAAPFRRPRASTPVPRFAPAPRDRGGGVAEVLGQGLAEGGFQPPARVPARSRASSVAMSRRDAGS